MCKEALLAESIAKMHAQLKQYGFKVETYDWHNPVPHVWSVCLRDCQFQQLEVRGKGVSQATAEANAMYKFFERLSSDSFFSDTFYGEQLASAEFVHHPRERWFAVTKQGLPEGLLDEPTRAHFNFDGELTAAMLVDTNSGNTHRGICALPFIRQQTQQTVWIPVNIIQNIYTTNGLGAGKSIHEARVRALSSIFARHIKTTILTAGISLPHIPDSVVEHDERVRQTIAQLRAEGFVIYVMDASLSGKFPLVCITLLDPQSGGCIAAFGAHPKFSIALQRAMVELLYKRSLAELKALPPPTFDLQAVAEPANLYKHLEDSSGVVSWELFAAKPDYEYTAWNVEGDTQEEFAYLCHLIHRVDMDIYIADFNHLGTHCCRVIVPGMADMFPVDRLVYQNHNRGIALRSHIMRLPMLDTHERQLCAQLLSHIEDTEMLASLCGISAQASNGLIGVMAAEVKALLCLAEGDINTAMSLLARVLAQTTLPAKKERLYRCLYALGTALNAANIVANNFHPVLTDIYGVSCFKRCEAMLAGRQLFNDFTEIKTDFSNSAAHQQFLSAFARLQHAKKSSVQTV